MALSEIIGVVAGQFVNAHREDRRWRREQAREREERELETERYWRDQRLRIYTAFPAAISNLRVEMRYAYDKLRDGAELDRALRERRLDLAATARNLYAPLGVVDPAYVRHQATELIRVFAESLSWTVTRWTQRPCSVWCKPSPGPPAKSSVPNRKTSLATHQNDPSPLTNTAALGSVPDLPALQRRRQAPPDFS